MRHLIITLFLYFITNCSFSQINDSSISKSSDPIKISYTSKKEITEATITLVKFKSGKYGIQMLFASPPNYVTNKFISSMDSLTLVLTNNKQINLIKPYRDTVFQNIGDILYWQTTQVLERDQINLLEAERITRIQFKYDTQVLFLDLKRKSQNEINSKIKLF